MPKFRVAFVARNSDAEKWLNGNSRTYEIEAENKWEAEGMAWDKLRRALRQPRLGYWGDPGLLPGYGYLVKHTQQGSMSVLGLIRVDVDLVEEEV